MKKFFVLVLIIAVSITQFNCSDDDSGEHISLEASISSDSKLEGKDLIHNVVIDKSTKIQEYKFKLKDNTSDKSTDYDSPVFSNGVTLLNNSISIPADVSNFTITIPTREDLEGEPEEFYKISIEDITATGTIIDHYVEVQDFIWKGLNLFSLWQENVPNLADNKFNTQDDYVRFINNASGT